MTNENRDFINIENNDNFRCFIIQLFNLFVNYFNILFHFLFKFFLRMSFKSLFIFFIKSVLGDDSKDEKINHISLDFNQVLSFSLYKCCLSS